MIDNTALTLKWICQLQYESYPVFDEICRIFDIFMLCLMIDCCLLYAISIISCKLKKKNKTGLTKDRGS